LHCYTVLFQIIAVELSIQRIQKKNISRFPHKY